MSLADDMPPEQTYPEPMHCDDCGRDYTAHREADYEECPVCDGPNVRRRD
jgi:Zn finger protein HypA/HybF involved in hydrogenase expression